MSLCGEESEDALFVQADAAFAMMEVENRAAHDEVLDSDDEDEWGVSLLRKRLDDARARTAVLPDGDVHVCDDDCPYVDEDQKEGVCVCRYTGLVVGRVCRMENSTGRSAWSSDPEMQSGVPIGGWGKRRDMMAASRRAYGMSWDLNDSEMPTAIRATRAIRRGAPGSPSLRGAAAACLGNGGKRGALCVDEAPREDGGPKRHRASRRDAETVDMRAALVCEAERTLLDLLGKRTDSGGSGSGKKDATPVDARLLDKDLLFGAALKKYLKEALASCRAPNMDDVSNIMLAVHRVISEEHAKRARSVDHPTLRVYEPQFREGSTRLAVTLWRAACQTPYLQTNTRGAVSFKHFCTGVFYAFKRGLTLFDGTVLVPKVDAFADALPSQKKIASDPAAKLLHASSHRGLCALHKCIGSVARAEASEFFADAARCARQLL